ncbi:MAG: tRNA (adenosine(37)-N6)-threonylcarbamoyltransferase complex ATPase subunit type 1 TsaE [Elusimicrobia bacterium]|nr:tRNA (adenosine(37)-N6)-threonylcarbamoyltransferase complex ATPase subunit type 1 TsaE [Elusimicrobiota bacterium]
MPAEAVLRLGSKGAEQTRAIGRRLGRSLRGGDVVLLVGDLGSGKTTFTQGIARGAGFGGRVASPTFVLVRVYRAPVWTLYHIDFYRVAEDQTRDIGIEDYVGDPNGICVVEWPAAGKGYLPNARLEVRFSYGRAENERALSIKAFGPRAEGLMRRLAPAARRGRDPS